MRKNYKFKLSLWFHLFLFVTSFGQNETISQQKGMAADAIQKIEASERWVDKFTSSKLVELPVGIRNTIGNVRYSIGITKAVFLPEYSKLTIFCRVDIPQKDQHGRPSQLFFGSDDVKLSHSGGLIGETKLVLLGNLDIPFSDNKWQLSLHGGFDMKTSNVDSNITYATIDCDGLKELKISGAVEFSRDLILPIDPITNTVNEAKTTISKTYYNGKTLEIPNRVRGEFNFITSNWNDILVNVTLQPFVLSKKRNGQNYDGNFQFMVSNAILDLSDQKNDPNVVFPQYFSDNFLLVPSEQSWKGVFVKSFEVGLPKEFQTTDSAKSKERVKIGAQNLLIDKYGVSGSFFADNVFPLDKGITSDEKAWAYSLDHIDITIEANTFVKANLSGQILLPISKVPQEQVSGSSAGTGASSQSVRTGFEYRGFISAEEQRLIVITKTNIKFDIWKADVTLYPNSSIELKLTNGKFHPKANLNGIISFATNQSATNDKEVNGNKTIDFKGITFENLTLQTVSPYISVRNMEYKGTVSFGNFPVSISNMSVTLDGGNANFYFDLNFKLMEEIGAQATARIGILGKIEDDGYKQRGRYVGLDLSAIKMDCEFSQLTFRGELILMDNDPVYGNGFSASLQVDVAKVVNVKATAIFGRTTFRYWYFDAAVNLDPPGGSPFMITGFGGGAYYKMRRSSNANIGTFSNKEMLYVPDEKINLGLKALIYFYIGQERLCNGEAGFEIAFNSKGGVNRIAIFGKAKLMPKEQSSDQISDLIGKVQSDPAAKQKFLSATDSNLNTSFKDKYIADANQAIPGNLSDPAGILMAIAMEIDFENNSFHAIADVYINTPGNFMTGTGPGGRAVWAVFHKDPKDWYFYLGTPADRCGIKISIAGIGLNTNSYFLTGSVLPESPPPPEQVVSILRLTPSESNYMARENSLANGGGLAFGASLDFDTGDMRFLMFYARFMAGIGFDIMLKDYQQAKCSNTGDRVGINGWYANGQAYAYLKGELGIQVKLSFLKLKVPILTAGAAVLLQAKLPNPAWLVGYVGGEMNILGGLIKGRFRFKLEIGNECKFENTSPLGGIKLISDVTPKESATGVDVFAIPQAAFAMKVNEAFVIPEDSGDVTYKVVIEKFKVFDGAKEIPGQIEFSTTKDKANFVSADILPPNKLLKVEVEVSFLKLVAGAFQPIYIDGKLATEYEQRSFTTGTAPDHIPLSNIQYCYPVVDQKYFLSEEYPQGYIALKRGQDYLFDDPNWLTTVRIQEKESSKTNTSAFTYDFGTNEVRYNLPNLDQESSYNINISSSIKQLNKTVENTGPKVTNITDIDNDIQVSENQSSAQFKTEGEIERLSYFFNTSKYRSFVSKMNSIGTRSYNFGVHYPDVIYLTNTISSQENFETTDLLGVAYTENKPLISAESALSDSYFNEDIYPTLYKEYPINGQYYFKNRDTNELGIIPSKAIPVNDHYISSILSNTDLSWTQENFPYKYNMALIYKEDWVDITNQVINSNLMSGSFSDHTYKYFIGGNFPFMRYGYYEIIMKYKLPGRKKETSYTYKFKNNIEFR